MKLSIKGRIIGAFLLLTTASLAFLGAYLLHFFYQKNLETATAHLITHARTIETALEGILYDAQKRPQLLREIQKISAQTQLRITILDAFGNVLADSWENADDLDNHLDRTEVQAALQSDYATAIRYSGTIAQNMLYVAIPVQQNGRLAGIVRTASTLAPLEANDQKTRAFILSAILSTMALTILAGIALAHRQTRPLEEMTRAASRIADGELRRRIHIHTNDEFEVLAHTINHLTASLEDKITEIHAAAEKSSLILENMDNAVLLLDRGGQIADANRSAKELFQITPDLLGHHSVRVLGDSTISQTAQEVWNSRQSQTITLKLPLQHGVKTFEIFFAPLLRQDDSVDSILSVLHDISALQEIYERQVDFVANASHELATPLTSIQGFSETLLDGAADHPETSRKFAGIIHKEARRMARLIESLLLLAKLDNREYRRQIRLEEVRLADVFAAVQARLAPQLARKRQTFQAAASDPEIAVRANYDWVMQIMMNLAENAVKYTPPDGLIELRARPDEGFALISIKNSGTGIAPRDLPFIFDRFYRADKARSRAAGGSGIGLSLVRCIVEMFGGKITAESQPNQGATFTFSLPLAI